MLLTVIVVASIVALALIVLMVGWSLNRAMRRKSVPYQAQTAPEKKRNTSPRKLGAALVITVGLVALLAFVVIPTLKSSSVDNGAWQTRAVTPVLFIGESVTQSTDSNGQWSHKSYIYDIGNSWRVASQDPLNIGQEYNIKGQIQKLTDGTTWLIEEARR